MSEADILIYKSLEARIHPVDITSRGIVLMIIFIKHIMYLNY